MDLTTSDGEDAMDTFYDEPEKAAELFARHIHDTWGVGAATTAATTATTSPGAAARGGGNGDDGSTGVLIFLSADDRTVFFSRGKALERVFRDRRIDAIIEGMKPLLRAGQYDEAILLAINELDGFLQIGPRVGLVERLRDWFETIVVLIIFGAVGVMVRKDIVSRREYARVSTQLSELDQARAEALQGTFKATSCPICLENFNKRECIFIAEEEAATSDVPQSESEALFGPERGEAPATVEPSPPESELLMGSDGLPLKLLRCGHAFDETCWQEWVNNGNAHSIHKCPICQQDIGDEPEQHLTSSSSTRVDPLSIPRGGHNDDRSRAFSRRRDDNTNNNDGEREGAIRRDVRSLALRQYTQERNFRLLRLAERYPQYIQRNELQRWTQVSYNGSLANDADVARRTAAEASAKGQSSFSSRSSGFGGGSSSGGRGGRL